MKYVYKIKSTGEYKLAFYHLEKFIQETVRSNTSDIELENSEDNNNELLTQYSRLFKVIFYHFLKLFTRC